MLNNDFSLPISFSLAAQIGLEEAVLLTFLKQQAYLANAKVLRVEISVLGVQLPFWTLPVMMRLLSNLQLSQLLNFQHKDDVLDIHFTTSIEQTNENAGQATTMVSSHKNDETLMGKMDRLHKAARSKEELPASSQPSKAKAFRAPLEQGEPAIMAPATTNRRGVTDFDLYLEQKERSRQPDQWQPEEATLEQIAQSGVTRDFALSLQTEFLLRIKEQRKNVRTWNSEFFKYVKRQWQYKQSDRSSYEGTSSNSTYTKTSREQVSDALTNIHDTDW